jgi:hypothetical protein
MGGKQIKLFLVDGTPGGLTTAEILNWTGHVLTGPRSELRELLGRPETKRTGVYLLLGEDESAVGDTRCYIGEGDEVAERLRHHQREKDFWDRVVVITSKDTNLTKSHGRYLESRMIALAKEAGRVSLENGTDPAVPALPEADASDMDYFLSQLQIILPVLGVNAIRVRPSRVALTSSDVPTESPVFHLTNARQKVDAHAQQIDGEFTLLTGSIVVPRFRDDEGKYAASTAKAYAGYRALHQRLVDDGSILIDADGRGRVSRDIAFTSPSTAGAVALGRSCNGRVEWVSSVGSFGVWESRGVE